jgi:hypothetical protein
MTSDMPRLDFHSISTNHQVSKPAASGVRPSPGAATCTSHGTMKFTKVRILSASAFALFQMPAQNSCASKHRDACLFKQFVVE